MTGHWLLMDGTCSCHYLHIYQEFGIAFSALTLLVGHQEENLACKN